MALCTLCPRACAVDRDLTTGVCGMPNTARVARAALHFGEEPAIGGAKGAGAVFFSGCSLRCVFCQNFELSRGRVGAEISSGRLSEIFAELEAQGASCIDLVNPTHFAPAVRKALLLRKPDIPVVWNSSGYETPETLRQMEGLVDVYLPDLKYSTTETARFCSAAPDYFPHAAKALREMARQTGPVRIGGDGLMKRGLLVRHLVLPGFGDETRKALTWLRRAIPTAWLSLMAQYTPCGDADQYPPLNRKLTAEEYQRAAALAQDLEFDGYLQEMESSGEEEIPAFDLTGVYTAAKAK